MISSVTFLLRPAAADDNGHAISTWAIAKLAKAWRMSGASCMERPRAPENPNLNRQCSDQPLQANYDTSNRLEE
ncbi:MAG: hypothetical protein WCS75_14580 [Sphingomonas sp.]|jgi:hypothetical protein